MLKIYHVGDDFPMKMRLLADSVGMATRAGLLDSFDYYVYLDGDSLLSCDAMEFFLWSASKMATDRRVKIASASGMSDFDKTDPEARAAAEGRGGSNWPAEFEQGSVTMARLGMHNSLSPHAWMVRREELEGLLGEVLSEKAKRGCTLCATVAKVAISKYPSTSGNSRPSADPYSRLLQSVLLGKVAITADVPRVSSAMVRQVLCWLTGIYNVSSPSTQITSLICRS